MFRLCCTSSVQPSPGMELYIIHKYNKTSDILDMLFFNSSLYLTKYVGKQWGNLL